MKISVQNSIENQERRSTTRSEVLWIIFVILLLEAFFHSFGNQPRISKIQSGHLACSQKYNHTLHIHILL